MRDGSFYDVAVGFVTFSVYGVRKELNAYQFAHSAKSLLLTHLVFAHRGHEMWIWLAISCKKGVKISKAILFIPQKKKKKDTARLVYVYFCLALYNYGKNNIRTTKYFSFYCHCRTLNRLGFLRHYFTTPFNRPHTDAFVHKNPSCGRQGNYFSSIESLMSM